MVCVADAGEPHGGSLVSTYVESEAERTKLVSEVSATIELSERQACDVASLITGAFSPLTGFMKKADYDSVVSDMRAKDGTLFGLPVVLDVSEPGLQGKKILLKYQGIDMAVMDVEEEWEPDKPKEAEKCYGTASDEHPTVYELMNGLGKYYVGGKVNGLLKGYEAVWGDASRLPQRCVLLCRKASRSWPSRTAILCTRHTSSSWLTRKKISQTRSSSFILPADLRSQAISMGPLVSRPTRSCRKIHSTRSGPVMLSAGRTCHTP
jgi:ATP sulfurylase